VSVNRAAGVTSRTLHPVRGACRVESHANIDSSITIVLDAAESKRVQLERGKFRCDVANLATGEFADLTVNLINGRPFLDPDTIFQIPANGPVTA